MNEQENLLMASEDKDARSASPSRTDTSAGARGGVINKIGNLLNRAPSIEQTPVPRALWTPESKWTTESKYQFDSIPQVSTTASSPAKVGLIASVRQAILRSPVAPKKP